MWTRAPVLAAERDQQRDRVDFRARAGASRARSRRRADRWSAGIGFSDGRPLGVHEQRHAGAAQDRQRERADRPRRRARTRRRPTATRKHLKPQHAGVDERLELAGVARHHAAPEPDVDVRVASRRRCLASSAHSVGRRRHAVERHVDEGRDPAGRRGRGVAVSKPSQSVRPGSLTWTCVSTMPGMTTRSPTSRICAGGVCAVERRPTRSMRVSRT